MSGPLTHIRVLDLSRVLADVQVRHRGMLRQLEHPLSGTVAQVVSPMRFSATEPDYENAPPLLGQHTDQVLGEVLGLDPAAIRALRDNGVVA